MQPKLGILAGKGDGPRRLIAAARASGREVFVIAFPGHTDPETTHDVEHQWVRLGAAGETIDALKRAGCQDIVLWGPIRRPSLAELRPDWRGAKLFARVGLGMLGDDGLLKRVRAELESEGLRVISPQDILTDLLCPAGLLTATAPDEAAQADINHGILLLNTLAPLDVGQAVVVQQGLVLAIEAIEGTAQMIARAGACRREGLGGVLVKISKTQQDVRLDLPTIGPDTLAQCQAAGLRGIAVEAGRSILLDHAAMVAQADAAGLFIIGLELLP